MENKRLFFLVIRSLLSGSVRMFTSTVDEIWCARAGCGLLAHTSCCRECMHCQEHCHVLMSITGAGGSCLLYCSHRYVVGAVLFLVAQTKFTVPNFSSAFFREITRGSCDSARPFDKRLFVPNLSARSERLFFEDTDPVMSVSSGRVGWAG